MIMFDCKNCLLVIVLYLGAELQLILGQNAPNSECYVATVCDGTGGMQKEWRQIRVNGIVGDRGAPGKRVSNHLCVAAVTLYIAW